MKSNSDVVQEEVEYKGKFRQLSKMTVKLNNNEIKEIETINSINDINKSDKFPSGVGIIAITKKSHQMVLIENFRFPINKKCIEFPAGMIDESEINAHPEKEPIDIVIDACKRELKEETGYEGEFCTFLTIDSNSNQVDFFTNIFADPWKSKDSTAMALFSIDLEKQNENKQELECCEIIKTYLVNINDLLQFISNKAINENYAIRSDLYALAYGMKFLDLFLK